MTAPASTAALPLARLLGHAADAVGAVRSGQSLNDALARCPPPARPGTQALAFHALRWLGGALAVRARLAPKAPPAGVDALLLTAIALLWPDSRPPYSEHTLVNEAVAATRQRAPATSGFVNAVLRRFLREREALVAATASDPVATYQHPAWWIDRLRALHSVKGNARIPRPSSVRRWAMALPRGNHSSRPRSSSETTRANFTNPSRSR